MSWAYHLIYWAETNHWSGRGGMTCSSMTKQSNGQALVDRPGDPNVWYISAGVPASKPTKTSQTVYIRTVRMIPLDGVSPVVGMAGMERAKGKVGHCGLCELGHEDRGSRIARSIMLSWEPGEPAQHPLKSFGQTRWSAACAQQSDNRAAASGRARRPTGGSLGPGPCGPAPFSRRVPRTAGPAPRTALASPVFMGHGVPCVHDLYLLSGMAG